MYLSHTPIMLKKHTVKKGCVRVRLLLFSLFHGTWVYRPNVLYQTKNKSYRLSLMQHRHTVVFTLLFLNHCCIDLSCHIAYNMSASWGGGYHCVPGVVIAGTAWHCLALSGTVWHRCPQLFELPCFWGLWMAYEDVRVLSNDKSAPIYWFCTWQRGLQHQLT